MASSEKETRTEEASRRYGYTGDKESYAWGSYKGIMAALNLCMELNENPAERNEFKFCEVALQMLILQKKAFKLAKAWREK